MDLYRALRLSIYLLVASGALSVWAVEDNIWYLLIVFAGATLAHVTVDSGRWRPLRSGLAGAFCLALLLHFLVPALQLIGLGEPRLAAERMSHYLIVVQVTLFFTAFRGSAVFTFCGSSLFVVVVSGILDSGPGLLVRLLIYLAATMWTLFLHSLWRERSRYLSLEASTSRSGRKVGDEPTGRSGRMQLSERTLWEGLRLSAVVSLLCLIFGFLLFFAWPRMSGGLFAELMNRLAPPSREPISEGTDGEGGLGRPTSGDGAAGGRDIGLGGSVGLEDLGNLHSNEAPAVTVAFDRPIRQVARSDGRLYLRARSFHTFFENRWRKPEREFEAKAKPGRDVVEFSPNFPNHLAPGGQRDSILQDVTIKGYMGRAFLSLAPVRSIELPNVVEDEEGNLLAGTREVLVRDSRLGRYKITADRPVSIDHIPANAVCDNREKKYLTWRWSFLDDRRRAIIKERVDQIVFGAGSDTDRVIRIVDHLRLTDNYRYTLRLGEIKRTRDAVGDFLLGGERLRRGHCGFFATACVLMCRAAGLPSRLASGYAHTVPIKNRGFSTVTFRNSEAHAWAEVYFKHYGWVAVDATPGEPYVEPTAISRVEPAPPEIDQVEPAHVPVATAGDPSVVRRAWSYFLKYDSRAQKNLYGSVGGAVSNFFDSIGAFMTGTGFGGVFGAALLWIIFGALVAVVCLSWIRSKDRRRDRVAHMTPRAKAAVRFYDDLLSALSKRGFVRRSDQTPREFAESVVRRGGMTFHPVLEVTYVFERVRYGGEDIGPDELERVKSAFSFLEERQSSSNA